MNFKYIKGKVRMKVSLVGLFVLIKLMTYAMAKEDVSISYSLVRDATIGQGELTIDSTVGIWKRFGSIAPVRCMNVSHDVIETINIDAYYDGDFISIEKTQSGNYLVIDDYYHKKFAGNPRGSSTLDFNVYFNQYSLGTFKVDEDIYLAKALDRTEFYCINLFIYKRY